MNRLVTSIVASMVALSALSQVKGEQPQLVVGIVIDQLRSDYIELLQSRMGQGGFNRLMRSGAYTDNIAFDCGEIDAVAGASMVMSGAYPRINGIAGARVFNAEKLLATDVFTDTRYMGNFTTETYSPMALRVSTLADEVRIDNNGLGAVHAIAPDAQMAMALAGHAANSAFWISDTDGKWATSTFYKDVPQTITARNYNRSLAQRLDTMSWVPSRDLSVYTVPGSSKYYNFRHTFPRSARDRYKMFKQSALVNQEVTDVALDYLQNMKLGTRGELDMLNIALTAGPYNWTTGTDGRLEQQDIYLRLDAQLERIINAIDKQVGLSRAVVFVTSTGHYDTGRAIDARFNIPTGEFRPERAKSLLNMYLMALYGNGSWVSGYYNGNIYLNRSLIKEKNLELSVVRARASEFLRQMSGVTSAYTYEEILNNPASDDMKSLNRSMIPDLAGDVIIAINPGWDIVESVAGSKVEQVKHVRSGAMGAPLFILAPQVPAKRLAVPVEAIAIAPTVARLLRIRSPNAAGAGGIALQ